jgi:DNA polymerase V
MFALIDCNNFYVSCERLFRPDLVGQPVAVLSNNDGCIVARSPEVKALGVKMGAPLFQIRDLLRAHRVALFSSNYTLYGDLSQRIMTVLRDDSPTIEVYSIDEAFLHDPHLPPREWEAYAIHLRAAVGRAVGIPVSVGVATTKTLAKLASRLAKKRPDGVCALSTPHELAESLARFEVGDVWGIGRRHAAMLAQQSVFTAADLVRLPEPWVRKQMTITGLRTHRELRGIVSLPPDQGPPPRRSMVHSRSLGRPVRDAAVMKAVLARYASALGHRLRTHHLLTRHLRVFLTAPRRAAAPSRAAGQSLPHPTADDRDLVTAAWRLLGQLGAGSLCSKAGVMALDLHSDDHAQGALFTPPPDARVMAALDAINTRFGRGTIRLAAEGSGPPAAAPKQQRRSPRYTTRWSELREVDVDAVYRR